MWCKLKPLDPSGGFLFWITPKLEAQQLLQTGR
jgi:hypothetical protein